MRALPSDETLSTLRTPSSARTASSTLIVIDSSISLGAAPG
jgi:hypothetical protein